MKNRKSYYSLLLALVLAAGMVACGTKPAEDTDGKDGSEEAKALYELSLIHISEPTRP